MTFVKLIFALLILVPVVILMWYLVNKLISEFTASVKKSRDEARAKEKASRELSRRQPMEQGKYGSFRQGAQSQYPRSAYPDPNQEQERTQEPDHKKGKDPSGVKRMMDKRKRRKERRTKKDTGIQKDKE